MRKTGRSSARAAVLGLAAAGLLAAGSPADAQLFLPRRAPAVNPCVLDKCLSGAPQPDAPPPAAPAGGGEGGFARGNGMTGVAPGAFDFYVLSLSWSPGFCDTGGETKAPDQCAPGTGLGFVVHGLWPQNQHGFPSDCDGGAGNPPRAALEGVRGLYPDLGLARHEWRKHGTCTGLAPAQYFAAVRRARDSVAVPADLHAPAEPQTRAPLDIARAFAAANPGLRPDEMAVTCRQGELEEVRLCMAKDLRGFVPCPEVARDACRTRSISVMPVR